MVLPVYVKVKLLELLVGTYVYAFNTRFGLSCSILFFNLYNFTLVSILVGCGENRREKMYSYTPLIGIFTIFTKLLISVVIVLYTGT